MAAKKKKSGGGSKGNASSSAATPSNSSSTAAASKQKQKRSTSSDVGGDGLAAELEAAAFGWGMDVLIEVHSAGELDRAMKLTSPLLGINNRNLKTLKTDIQTTRELAPRVVDALLRRDGVMA